MHVDLELLYYRKHDDDDGDDNEEDDDDVSKEVPDSSPALCLHVLSSLPLIYWLLWQYVLVDLSLLSLPYPLTQDVNADSLFYHVKIPYSEINWSEFSTSLFE